MSGDTENPGPENGGPKRTKAEKCRIGKCRSESHRVNLQDRKMYCQYCIKEPKKRQSTLYVWDVTELSPQLFFSGGISSAKRTRI